MSKINCPANIEPTQELLAGWAQVERWSPQEAVPLAFGLEPTGTNTSFDGYRSRELGLLPEQARALVIRADAAARDPRQGRSPRDWLRWGDKSGMWFHTRWWYAIAPEGPIGPDGRHFIESREFRHSETYRTTLHELIMNWSQAPSWSHEIAVVLTMNICPSQSTDEEAYLRESERPEFRRRLDHLHRAIQARTLNYALRPRAVLEWAARSHWFVEPAWFRAVPEHRETEPVEEVTVKDETASFMADNRAIHPRVKDTLLKMIAGMAIKGYAHDPNAARSETAGDVAGDVRQFGHQISDDAVRTYLREAMELIDQNVLKEIGKKY